MNKNIVKCYDCGHPMQFLRKEENAYYDENSVYDFTEWNCPWCEKMKIFGFPPVQIREDNQK